MKFPSTFSALPLFFSTFLYIYISLPLSLLIVGTKNHVVICLWTRFERITYNTKKAKSELHKNNARKKKCSLLFVPFIKCSTIQNACKVNVYMWRCDTHNGAQCKGRLIMLSTTIAHVFPHCVNIFCHFHPVAICQFHRINSHLITNASELISNWKLLLYPFDVCRR